MRAAQVRELSRAFEIGAHTLHHVVLTSTTDQQAWQAIIGSKSWVEENTSLPRLVFCARASIRPRTSRLKLTSDQKIKPSAPWGQKAAYKRSRYRSSTFPRVTAAGPCAISARRLSSSRFPGVTLGAEQPMSTSWRGICGAVWNGCIRPVRQTCQSKVVTQSAVNRACSNSGGTRWGASPCRRSSSRMTALRVNHLSCHQTTFETSMVNEDVADGRQVGAVSKAERDHPWVRFWNCSNSGTGHYSTPPLKRVFVR
jgi:hypothetical protein